MSDRLRNLLETIDRALYGQGSAGFSPAHELLVSGWMLALQEEIAERERPLEGALAEILREHDVDREIVIATQAGWPETRGARLLSTLRARIEALALRGARPATRAEWALVAADLAQDEGVVSEDLARVVAGLLPALLGHESVRDALAAQPLVGAWNETRETRYNGTRSFETVSLSRFAYAYKPAAMVIPRFQPGTATITDYLWATYTDEGDRRLWQTAPTLREAMLAADAALRTEGRILLGGLPDEVATPAVTYELSVNTKPLTEALEQTGERIRRFIGADVGASQDGAFIVVEQDQLDRMRMVGRVSDERATATVDEDDPQPDASWLRLMGRDDRLLGVQTWRYQGSTEDARPLMLIDWLEARRLLYSSSGSADEGMHQIVTRAPLDLGAREAP